SPRESAVSSGWIHPSGLPESPAGGRAVSTRGYARTGTSRALPAGRQTPRVPTRQRLESQLRSARFAALGPDLARRETGGQSMTLRQTTYKVRRAGPPIFAFPSPRPPLGGFTIEMGSLRADSRRPLLLPARIAGSRVRGLAAPATRRRLAKRKPSGLAR